MNASVILRIEGPLQSYRQEMRSRISGVPTRTAVAGMIAAALGHAKLQPVGKKSGGIADMSGRDAVLEKIVGYEVVTLRKGTVVLDYKTTGGMRYPDELLTLHHEGHPSKTPCYGVRKVEDGFYKDAILEDVPLIVDASFDAIVEFNDLEYADQVVRALCSPKYPVYLGRACMMPSVPLLPPRAEPILATARELAINLRLIRGGGRATRCD